MSFKDALTQINTLYHNSVSADELWDGLKELDELLSGGLLNRENLENAEALYLRLVVKIRFTEYLVNFDKAVFNELCDYISTEKVKAEKRGYKKTLKVFGEAAAVLNGINGIVSEVIKINESISDGASATLIDSALNSLHSLLNCAESGNFQSPFGEEVRFPDIKVRITDYLNKAVKRAEELKKTEDENRARENFKEISAFYSLAEYFPLPEYDEGGKSNAVVVLSPVDDEAILYCAHACREGAKLFILDARKLDGKDENFVKGLFETAVNLGYDLLIQHSDTLAAGKRNQLYGCAMRAGKAGVRVFIHDRSGDNGIYETCLQIAVKSDLSVSDISCAYVTMPAFGEVCREFEAKGLISGPADYDILKEMPFMGFAGLNKTVNAFIAGADWIKTGKKYSSNNAPLCKAYLSKLKSSYLLIDSGWGDFTADDKKTEVKNGEFDYDGVKEIDRENVRRIIESGHTVFAKCGMIARYCTLGGGDKSDWDRMERSEMTERIVLATKLVFRILNVETVPQVDVLDELANKGAGGLCCDGGKKVLFSYSSCRNWNWIVNAIVHESFHALQAKLRQGGWSEWYFTNLGITRGRVERWSYTNNIYNSNVNSDVYKVHIIEADAQAFEVDCDDGRNYAWNTVELV